MLQPALAMELETEPQGSCTSITPGKGLGLFPHGVLVQDSEKGSDVTVVVFNMGHSDHIFC